MVLDPRLEIMALDAQIDALSRSFREEWIFRRLKPEHESEYNGLQSRLTHLLERKVEIERELGIDQEAVYGR